MLIQTEQGLCQCGCKQPTRIATKTDRSNGQIKGMPVSYIIGHNKKPKNGICSNCGTSDRYSDGRCKQCSINRKTKCVDNKAGIPCPDCGTAKRYSNGSCVECFKFSRRYYNQIPEVKAKNNSRSRARARSRINLTPEQISRDVWCRAQSCTYCGGPGGTTDHVICLDKGGTWDTWNLVPACMTCNDSKGTKWLEEWRQSC